MKIVKGLKFEYRGVRVRVLGPDHDQDGVFAVQTYRGAGEPFRLSAAEIRRCIRGERSEETS